MEQWHQREVLIMRHLSLTLMGWNLAPLMVVFQLTTDKKWGVSIISIQSLRPENQGKVDFLIAWPCHVTSWHSITLRWEISWQLNGQLNPIKWKVLTLNVICSSFTNDVRWTHVLMLQLIMFMWILFTFYWLSLSSINMSFVIFKVYWFFLLIDFFYTEDSQRRGQPWREGWFVGVWLWGPRVLCWLSRLLQHFGVRQWPSVSWWPWTKV